MKRSRSMKIRLALFLFHEKYIFLYGKIFKEGVQMENLAIGALTLVALICVAGLYVNSIRLHNRAIAAMQKRRQGPWTWD